MIEDFKAAKSFLQTETLGLQKDTEVIEPASVSLFLNKVGGDTLLPPEIATNPKLLEQASKRRELYSTLGNLFEKVKDGNMDIDEAIEKGIVRPEEIAEMYKQLNHFIETDENNTRIILYLPFQLLPNLYGRKKPDRLAKAQLHFKDIYIDAWIRLLHESEQRASFIDGDVLEPGLGKPERIRKAGHLTPEVLQRGLIDARDVIDMLDISNNEELLRSLTEGVVVAKDKRLIDDIDWRTIQDIGRDKQAVNKVLQMMKVAKKENPQEKVLSINEIVSRLNSDLERIEDQYAPNSSYVPSMSAKRAKWEKGVKKDKAIDKTVDHLVQKFQNEEVTINNLIDLEERDKWQPEFSIVGIRTITETAKLYSKKNPDKAKSLINRSFDHFNKLWENGDADVRDEIIRTMCHLRRLDLVQDGELDRLGIKLPDLSALLPVKLDELLSDDLSEVVVAIKKIKDNSHLSQSVFPYFLAFGSRVKGYATTEADLDLAVFIKPEALWDKREEIHKKLQSLVPSLPERNEMPQFWLDQQGGTYTFKNVPNEYKDWVVTGEKLVHFIFGGVWIGQGEDGAKIRGDLLRSYLDLSRFKDKKDEIRSKFLGRLEMDMLQYRLMHKGYRRYYPGAKQSSTQNSDLIDWESDFWDPGYRRVATQLFLSRVFLPDLSSDFVRKNDESVGQ